MNKNLLLGQNRINFIDQNEGQSKAIIFVHGNSLSAHSFKRQLHSPDLQEYRLLAMNLPGHGDSSADDSYDLPRFSQILSGFISALDLTDYILVGHSLGGHVVLESLEFLNPAGVMIIGTPPVTKPLQAGMFLPHPAMELLYKNDLSDSEILTLLQAFGSDDVHQFKKTDPAFRRLFAEGLSQSLFKDELLLLKNYRGRKAFVLGSEDPLVNREYMSKNIEQELLILKGGHSVQYENAEDFNIALLEFAADCFYQSYMKTNISTSMAHQL